MIYKGRREGRHTTILAGEDTLPTAKDVFRHSDQREWGHLGSEPAQLALDILYHHTRNQTFALTYHQQFKQQVISNLPIEGWTITEGELDAWIDENTPFRSVNQ
jgi:hypothetical protein